MTYLIEKGIPIPKAQAEYNQKKNYPIYPFRAMQVGDSILISDVYSRTLMSKYNSAARNWSNKAKAGYKFTTRKVDEGIRIWRTE